MALSDFFSFSVKDTPCSLSIKLSLPFIVIIVAMFGFYVLWEQIIHEQALLRELRETAEAQARQIKLTQLWNSRHGGIYVEQSALPKDEAGRIETAGRRKIEVDGRVFVEVNAARMTSQLAELAREQGTYRFKLTSLRPVNPENAPDPWERRQLEAFEKGKREAENLIEDRDPSLFRYITPLYVDKSCLRCHPEEADAPGGVRGGLSLEIPVTGTLAAHRERATTNMLAFALLCIISTVSFLTLTWLVAGRLVKALQVELENERLKAAYRLAGAAAHEMRQPLSIINTVVSLIEKKLKAGETVETEAEILTSEGDRLNRTLERMLNITRYRTRAYTEDEEIVDLWATEDEEEGGEGKG